MENIPLLSQDATTMSNDMQENRMLEQATHTTTPSGSQEFGESQAADANQLSEGPTRADGEMEAEAQGPANIVPTAPPPQRQVSEAVGDPFSGIWEILGSSPSEERLDRYKAFERNLKLQQRAWIARGRDPCEKCSGDHRPPCFSEGFKGLMKAVRKEGQRLRKEANKAKAKKEEEEKKNEDTETVGSNARAPVPPREPKAIKRTLCPLCAKWHHGGAQACRARTCIRCNRGHFQTETCSAAKSRFRSQGFPVSEDEDEDEAEAQANPLSEADVSKLRGLLDTLGNDNVALRKVGQLMNSMGKRKAEDPEKSGSLLKAKKGKKEEEKKRNMRVSRHGCKPASKPSRRPDDDRDGNNQGRPGLGGRAIALR